MGIIKYENRGTTVVKNISQTFDSRFKEVTQYTFLSAMFTLSGVLLVAFIVTLKFEK